MYRGCRLDVGEEICHVNLLRHVTSGRIKAIQLEYSEARRTLTNALRKAPQHTAVGFKQTVSTPTHVPHLTFTAPVHGVWETLGQHSFTLMYMICI